MTTVEEVQAKLSMDTSTLGRAKRELAEFNAGGHAGFLHHTNGAREFHKSLHELTDQVPVLGVAFRALLSPIGAALTGATLLFEWGKKKLEEWNAELDKTAARNAKAVFGREDLRTSERERSNMQRDFESFGRRHDESVRKMLEALDDEQDKLKGNLEMEKERLKLRQELAREIIKQQVGSGAMSADAGMKALMALGISGKKEERALEAAKLAEEAKMLDNARSPAEANLRFNNLELAKAEASRENNAHKLAKSEGMLRTSQEDETAAREASDTAQKGKNPVFEWRGPVWKQWAGEKADRLFKAWSDANNVLKEQADKVEALRKKQGELNEAYSESKEKVTQWRAALDAVTKEKARVANAQAALQSRPLGMVRPEEFQSPETFTTGELAGYNSRYGAIARQILNVQQRARGAAAAGNFDLARDLREGGTHDFPGPGMSLSRLGMQGMGVQDLYNLLPKGLTREQRAQDQSKAMVDSILAALGHTSKGIPVDVTRMANGG